MKNRLKNISEIIIILMLGAALLIFRENVASGVKNGLSVCGNILIPSMFPFMALSSFSLNSGIFSKFDRILSPVMNKLFALPGICFAAVFFGFIGGYPVGAKIICELYESDRITKDEARRLFAFCVNPGPAFIVSAAGGVMLSSEKAGFIMLSAMLIASMITGVAVSVKSPRSNLKRSKPTVKPDFALSLTSAVSSALSSTLSVCAWVLTFSAFSEIIKSVIPDGNMKNIFEIISEVTTGITPAAKLGGLPLAAAVASFGGICVMCQLMPFIKKCGIKATEYLLFRILNAVLTFFGAKIILLFTDVSITVSSIINARAFTYSAPASAALLLMGASLILSTAKENSVKGRSGC